MYTATLKDGKAIAIPSWPIDVALQNLTNSGKYLGTEHIIEIANIDTRAVIVAIMAAQEPAQVASVIKNFVCTARVDGSKIEPGNIDQMFDDSLAVVAEIFAHVVHAQYFDFFELGLAKAPSPSK